jgi:hypothetical protein
MLAGITPPWRAPSALASPDPAGVDEGGVNGEVRPTAGFVREANAAAPAQVSGSADAPQDPVSAAWPQRL